MSSTAWPTSHPHLVSLYELVVDESTGFFTMELGDGVHFDEWVRAGGSGDEASSIVPTLRRFSKRLREVCPD